MTIRRLNHTLEDALDTQENYAGLVYRLATLGCSDKLIEIIAVGALGEAVRSRITPLIGAVRGYENLSSSEQIALLYAIVDVQGAQPDHDEPSARRTA